MEKRTPTTTQTQMQIELQIMKSILKNHCGADTSHIVNELKSLCSEGKTVIEGIQRLKKAGIISFTQYGDYVFDPDVSSSPLIRELKKKTPPTVTIEEYELYGWRKLARLI